MFSRKAVRTLVLLLWAGGAVQAQDTTSALHRLEERWLEFRDLRDQLGITRNLGATVLPRGVPAESLSARSGRMADRIREMIAQLPAPGLNPSDARAFDFLRDEFTRLSSEDRERPRPDETPPDCAEPYPSRLRTATLEVLTARTFACYGAAARNIVVGRDTLDRLAILGLLGRTDNPARRRRQCRPTSSSSSAPTPRRKTYAMR